jgi:hypothetical protein
MFDLAAFTARANEAKAIADPGGRRLAIAGLRAELKMESQKVEALGGALEVASMRAMKRALEQAEKA